MQLLIAVLILSTIAFMVISLSIFNASPRDPKDDEEQERYIREWREKHPRNGRKR